MCVRERETIRDRAIECVSKFERENHRGGERENERERASERIGASQSDSHTHTHTHTHTHSGERGREREKRLRTRHIGRLKAEKSGREKRL